MIYKEARRDLPTASSSSSIWDRTHWKTSSWNYQHSSRSDELWKTKLLRVRTSFACWEINFQTFDGECKQNTHSYSMYRYAQCVTTHTDQNDHMWPRAHAWLKIAHLSVPKQLSSTCHVSFLAAPDTDHKHKFSLTYLTFLSDNLTNKHKTFGARSILPCEVPRQSGGSTQIPSLTHFYRFFSARYCFAPFTNVTSLA